MPVIYAGGGILKADATKPAARARRAHRHPGGDDADGARRDPGRASAVPRHARHARQLHRGHVDAEGRPAHHLGARFDDRVTGKTEAFAPNAKMIHVDIDPAELGKVRRPDVPIVGDCQNVIERLIKAVKAEQASTGARPRRLGTTRCTRGSRSSRSATSSTRPGRSSRSSASRRCATTRPRTRSSCPAWASTRCGRASSGVPPAVHVDELGGLGTMGFAVPAAIGAKVGTPERMVWAIDGDGCFQMTAQELVTASAGADPGEDRDPEQRLPRHGPPVAGALLRGALQRGVPLARPARLREVGRGDGLRRLPCRHAGGRRADDREGERDRRPTGRDRLPHRLPREGVPDGRRGNLQRRHHPRPRVRPSGGR